MSQRPPVKDWATDFDHLDPRWIDDPFPIWDELRQKCPIAHTDRFKGVYLPTRYEDVRAIAYDPEHFSSRKVIVRESPPPANNGAPPITSDPPRHRLARMALLPPFTPQAIDKLIPKARADLQRADRRLHRQGQLRRRRRLRPAHPGQDHRPHAGHSRERRRPLPRLDQGRAARTASPTRRRCCSGFQEIREYFTAHLIERRKNPGDDLISYLTLQTYPDGRPFTDNHVLGTRAAAAGGRHRHHLERHRLVPVAPGQDARGPPPAGAGAGADADGDRGVPARLLRR